MDQISIKNWFDFESIWTRLRLFEDYKKKENKKIGTLIKKIYNN